MKPKGTKQEVWDGLARRTPGGLTKADLVLNSKGKPASAKQVANGKKNATHLPRPPRGTPRPHPDHKHGYKHGMKLREMHGNGLLGGLLGSVLGPVLGGISPVLGDLAPAVGAALPF